MNADSINIEQIHARELKCLIFLDKICRQNNLRYSLAYGTLLGAIRHKGFIPWDDDADVMMPIEDYKKLVDIFESGKIKDSSFNFFNPGLNSKYYYTVSRLADTSSRIVPTNNDKEIPGLGVFIDIYPYYYAFDDKKLYEIVYSKNIISQFDRFHTAFNLRKLYHQLKIASSFFYGANNPDWMPAGNLQGLSEKNKMRLVKLFRKILKITGSRWCYWIYCYLLSRLPKNSSIYYDPHSLTYFESSLFDNLIELDFEGQKFLATPLWERVLVSIYGDYLTPPPAEMRGSRHHYLMQAL